MNTPEFINFMCIRLHLTSAVQESVFFEDGPKTIASRQFDKM